MASASQATETFRFICTRPANLENQATIIRVHSEEQAKSPTQQSETTLLHSAISGGPTPQFTNGKEITALGDQLKLGQDKLEIGRTIELNTSLVHKAFRTVFGDRDLTELVESPAWTEDRNRLDNLLASIWRNASDPTAAGPALTRQRQLYDLVEQVANSESSEFAEKSKTVFHLKGLHFGSRVRSPLDRKRKSAPESSKPGKPNHTSQKRGPRARDVALSDNDPKNTASLTAHFAEGLDVLNSSAILRYRTLDKSAPSKLLISSGWGALLSPDARQAIENAGILPSSSTANVTWYYARLLGAMRSAIASSSTNAAPTSQTFRAGLFSIGPFSIEMMRPWTWDASTALDVTGTGVPEENPPLVKARGVGDLMVVRDHLWKYVGGDIGAIQNVLKSEWLIRETKSLEKTTVVNFVSTENQTEQSQEDSTTTRVSLSTESNDVIKKDASKKYGVSLTGSYGPYVKVKADVSTAENKSSESSNKMAFQYAQDVVSRATSKIIEKTVKSTTTTTVSQFQDNNRHEFKNVGQGTSNISGVYQWVNKVSQCQTWNYGKRLLIDIVVPEPAAFLMTQSTANGPLLASPPPLTETAADLHENNYSTIAARYQATGIKPPGDLLMSFSHSFKADVTGSGGPKFGGGGSAHRYGGSATVNQDFDIPAGYLAYAAQITVGVRTGPSVIWSKWEDQLEPRDQNEPSSWPKAFPFISVAGRVVRSGQVKATDLESNGATISDDEKTQSLEQDTIGSILFDEPLLQSKIAVSISQDFCLAMSGTIQVYCVRDPNAYATWQQTTYDSIATAYAKAKLDYERSRSETAISSLSVVTGNNPLENVSILSTELKKAAISFLTAQNYQVFGTVEADQDDGIPEVNDFPRALRQGRYMQFFEEAFEWENMTYDLYPYFWAKRDTWRERMGFQSPDPTFTSFVKAGAAKVTVPARLGHGLEVVHLLDSGKLWHEGPVSTLTTSEYYSIAQEILAAEANPQEVKVSAPWYTVVPTDLVQLRADSVLPRFKVDANGVWVERDPGDKDWDD